MSGVMGVARSVAGVIEHTTYYVANTIGVGLQLVSGAFLAQRAWQYAHKPQGSFWSTPPAQTSNWVSAPIKGAADYSGFDPVTVASAALVTGTLLTLMGRSAAKTVKDWNQRGDAVDALTERTREYTRALNSNTEAVTGNTKAIQANIAAVNLQNRTVAALTTYTGSGR